MNTSYDYQPQRIGWSGVAPIERSLAMCVAHRSTKVLPVGWLEHPTSRL